jgi:hypothetical protein
MKAKKKKLPDSHQVIADYLTTYAYIPEMRTDGSDFEKRKIKKAFFSTDRTQLVISGGSSDELSYTIMLKTVRKVYSRTDREYDKIIIRGFISMGEDFTLGDRHKLTIYLKGYSPNLHIAHQIKNALLTFSREVAS